jgi:hypothetical protein
MSEVDVYQLALQVEQALAAEGVIVIPSDQFGLSQAITVGVLKVLDELGNQADTALLIPVPHKEGVTDD